MRRLLLPAAILLATCASTSAMDSEDNAGPVSDEFVDAIVAQVDDAGEIELAPEPEYEEAEDPCDSGESSAVTLLSCMRTGTWEQRLTAVDWLPDALGALGDDPEKDARTVDEAIDLLIRIMHDEPDDWISRSMLDSLEYEDGPGIARLFRAALEEASVNLQGKGVAWLELEEDPEALDALERLWRTVVPSWLRRGMILALANQPLDQAALDRHLEEFIALTRDADPEIRLAALEALGTMADPAALPALLRAAHDGTPDDRVAALEALGELPESDESMVELRRAIRSGDSRICGAAIRTLDRFEHPDAETLILEVLDRSTNEGNLVAAVMALERSKHPDATLAIARLLERLDPAAHDWLTSEVVSALHNRDDVEALGVLTHLSPPSAAVPGGSLADLVDYLSRDRANSRGSIFVTTRCGIGRRMANASGLVSRRIAPAPPFETVRCWEAPSVAGRSWESNRIDAGMLVEIVDYFERPGQTWVEVVGRDIDCWVPIDDLVAADTPPPARDPTRPPRLELDLSPRDVVSAQARALIDEGLMEVLETDEDSGVVAAALTVDPADPDQVALLEAASTGRRGVLDRAIARLMHACCGPLP